jgi:hypothetical protein
LGLTAILPWLHPSLPYFPIRTSPQRLCSPFMSDHPNFIKQASFMLWSFRIPIHPHHFGWDIVSQLIKCAFLFSSVSPQTNARWAFSISFKQLFGISVVIIGYIGIAWMTDFANVILPARDNCFAFQPVSLVLCKKWL